jgi:protein phosphatase 2C family protein 2/3
MSRAHIHPNPQYLNLSPWLSDMEDAHSIILNLNEKKDNANAFFAVFDGHSGEYFANMFAHVDSCDAPYKGDTTSKFASRNLHTQLVTAEAYREGEYEAALKRAFLDTDEQFRKSKFISPSL